MRTTRRITHLALTAPLLFQTALAGTGRRGCDRVPLKEGPVAGRGGLRLGKPVLFDDGAGISHGLCYPLRAGGALVAWVESLHAAGPRLFVRRCAEGPSAEEVPAGARGGSVKEIYEELLAGGSAAGSRFDALVPPLWSWHSNPSFCGPSVTYWGAEFAEGEPTKIYAMIFDLPTGRAVRKDHLGEVLIESDSRTFFPAPVWDAAGGRATFDAGRAKRSIMLNLKKVTLATAPR